MASSEGFETRRYQLEEDFDDNGGSDLEYDSDDSECDPSYTVMEETNARLSRLSIKKKSKPSKVADIELIGVGDTDDKAPNVFAPDENYIKDIDEVLKIFKAGKLEKLKVEQCKAYLRKNRLRLTGYKDTLIKRINEHLEISTGGGEKKYPECSFTVNCKGDACTGDVVMFEQRVYEMYNIACRSSIGPSCGTRIVAGRIVKESYGASKQQHTFTIEVLWSKGEKPLPPLHPLLIKGRNLYRLKTLRQSWEDEGERQKVLMEKHSRGSLARSNREVRVMGKEKRKMLQENRILRKERCSDNSSESNLTSAGSALAESMVSLFTSSRKLLQPQQLKNPTVQHMDTLQNNCRNQAAQNISDGRSLNIRQRFIQGVQPLVKVDPATNNYKLPSIYSGDYPTSVKKDVDATNRSNGSWYHRLPLSKMNFYPAVNEPGQQQNCKQQQRCRYYTQGRCYYGQNCKFLHEMTDKIV